MKLKILFCTVCAALIACSSGPLNAKPKKSAAKQTALKQSRKKSTRKTAAKPAAKPEKKTEKKPEKKLDNQSVMNELNRIQKNTFIRLNEWNMAQQHKDLMKYFSANRKKFANDWQVSQVLNKLAQNAARMKEDASFKKIVRMIEKELPERNAIQLFNGLVPSLAGTYSWKEELPRGEWLYEQKKALFDPMTKVSSWIFPKLVKQNLRFNGDVKKLYYYIGELLAVKPDPKYDKRTLERFENARKDTLVSTIGFVIEHDPDLGAEVLLKHEKAIGTDIARLAPLYISFCRAAVKNQNRKLYDTFLAKAEALPESDKKVETVCWIAALAKERPCGQKIFDRLLKKNLTPAQRFHILQNRTIVPQTFNYGFHVPGSYEKAKAIFQEMDKIACTLQKAAKNTAKDKAKPAGLNRDQLQWLYEKAAGAAFDFGDYAFGNTMLQKAVELTGPRVWKLQAVELVRQGKMKEASKVLEQAVNADKKYWIPQNDKDTAACFRYFIDGGTFDGFDKAFADKKLTPEQKMNLIRSAGNLFFRAKRFDTARKLNDEILAKMFRPAETNKRYTVHYWENAPKTAETWSRTPAYNDWSAMETRFSPYCGYDNHNDAQLLKDIPMQKLDDAYRSGLQIVCDESGVHIFARLNDPKVKEVDLGKRGGPNLEWNFRPGEGHAYHSFFMAALPDCSDEHYVNWAAPTKHYRLTYDGITKDAVTTPAGYAAHVFIPWLMFYDKMPSKNNVWSLGLQIWGTGFNRSLSGLVHELARGLKLDFDLTEKQRTSLERTVAIQAFNRYNKIRRNEGGVVWNWNDPVLGDPAFYKSELEPWIMELDEAGKKLMAPAPDGEIHAIFEKYVPQWAEINYIIDEKRAAYLRKKLLSGK